jgi:hypothetical protein
MPTPVKPCDGRFKDELQEVLTRNRDRDQWATHACEVCGVVVGAVKVQGKWVPEQHWPSVKYTPRNAVEKGRHRSGAPQGNAVLAGQASASPIQSVQSVQAG